MNKNNVIIALMLLSQAYLNGGNELFLENRSNEKIVVVINKIEKITLGNGQTVPLGAILQDNANINRSYVEDLSIAPASLFSKIFKSSQHLLGNLKDVRGIYQNMIKQNQQEALGKNAIIIIDPYQSNRFFTTLRWEGKSFIAKKSEIDNQIMPLMQKLKTLVEAGKFTELTQLKIANNTIFSKYFTHQELIDITNGAAGMPGAQTNKALEIINKKINFLK